MKNDLTHLERDLLRTINLFNNTRYTHKNFMEWGNIREVLEKNLQEGEQIYEALGMFVAIKLVVEDKKKTK